MPRRLILQSIVVTSQVSTSPGFAVLDDCDVTVANTRNDGMLSYDNGMELDGMLSYDSNVRILHKINHKFNEIGVILIMISYNCWYNCSF